MGLAKAAREKKREEKDSDRRSSRNLTADRLLPSSSLQQPLLTGPFLISSDTPTSSAASASPRLTQRRCSAVQRTTRSVCGTRRHAWRERPARRCSAMRATSAASLHRRPGRCLPAAVWISRSACGTRSRASWCVSSAKERGKDFLGESPVWRLRRQLLCLFPPPLPPPRHTIIVASCKNNHRCRYRLLSDDPCRRPSSITTTIIVPSGRLRRQMNFCSARRRARAALCCCGGVA